MAIWTTTIHKELACLLARWLWVVGYQPRIYLDLGGPRLPDCSARCTPIFSQPSVSPHRVSKFTSTRVNPDHQGSHTSRHAWLTSTCGTKLLGHGGCACQRNRFEHSFIFVLRNIMQRWQTTHRLRGPNDHSCHVSLLVHKSLLQGLPEALIIHVNF